MKSFMRRIAIVLLVVFTAFSAFACTNKPNDNNPPDNPPGGENTTPLGDVSYLDMTATDVMNSILETVGGYSTGKYSLNNNVVMDVTINTSAGFSNSYYNLRKYFEYVYMAYVPEEEPNTPVDYRFYGTTYDQGFEPVFGVPDKNVSVWVVGGTVYRKSNFETPDKIKDTGTYADFKAQKGDIINLNDKAYYVPANICVSDGYFNVTESGAILTIPVTGEHKKAFAEQLIGKEDASATVTYSDITFTVYLNDKAQLRYSTYSFTKVVTLTDGTEFVYDRISGTIRLTEIGRASVNLPSESETFIEQSDFIATQN